MLSNDEADFAASEKYISKDMKGFSEREWRMIPVFATAVGITYNTADFTFGSSFEGVPKPPLLFHFAHVSIGWLPTGTTRGATACHHRVLFWPKQFLGRKRQASITNWCTSFDTAMSWIV
jgi:hypothetical protein